MNISCDKTNTLRAQDHGHAPIIIQHNITDARYKTDESGICQTLTGRAGTGGGNVPMIIERKDE